MCLLHYQSFIKLNGFYIKFSAFIWHSLHIFHISHYSFSPSHNVCVLKGFDISRKEFLANRKMFGFMFNHKRMMLQCPMSNLQFPIVFFRSTLYQIFGNFIWNILANNNLRKKSSRFFLCETFFFVVCFWDLKL